MSWLSRLRRRRAAPAVDARRARTIIEAYGACLEQRPPGALRPDGELPYSKEEIGRAILLALKFSTGPETTAPLRQGFVELERFLTADEWAVIDEYQRVGRADGGSMAPERFGAARRILEHVDERCQHRLRLLAYRLERIDRLQTRRGGRL